MTLLREPWQLVVKKKKALQEEALSAGIQHQYDFVTEEIPLMTDAREIVGAIERGQTTARNVTQAFIHRAVQTHRNTNCLTEIAFTNALERANELDDYVQRNGKVAGPLHGVPITMKDQFNVKGLDTTLGYVGRAFDPATKSAVLVDILESLGAIIIAKSNIPQSIMWCETDNPLWGRTTNPRKSSYTPGGSTGGEAVLLSCDASILGWGTDIGGSIRIPAHMMGLYGLKPSTQSARLPYRGVPVSTEGQEHVPSSVGPMARSMETLTVATKYVIDAQPWKMDPRCVPIPWRAELYDEMLDRPLTVGVLLDDGVVQPHPPISRVLKNAIELLRSAGHDIILWNATLHQECIEVMDRFYTADGGEDIKTSISKGGEPLIPHVESLVGSAEPISVYEYWQLNRGKIALQQAYLDKWAAIRSPKTGHQADVLLMPPMPHSAVPHGGCRWVGYTKVWNLLDYPALVIPGGTVCTEDVHEAVTSDYRNPLDKWNKDLWQTHKKEMADLHMPVGLQLVCPKLEEEKVLSVGKTLTQLLQRNQS
ncbi:hypothetical protein QQS21_002078 [Conoideocrella luteorostrata]|uniref:Amidase domain-containing protein n=1 Tax=Conoideocrella luteorostrata TaxID=1105319 RepID=A0AAJ0CZR8_9HYPO|nr:hypothetical protein QQS21_002078 [Conoideocrella luteorostrata]